MPLARPEDAGKLAQALAPYRRALILTHNNPDPDALAAAAGLRLLVTKTMHKPAWIGYAGFLTRAENREMVGRLRLPVHRLERIDLRRFRAVILVDSQPSVGNNPLSARQTPVAVVDHHPLRRASLKCPFALVDRIVGATSTLVFEMLKKAGLKLPSNIATAMFFGIKTDTQDLGRGATARDQAAYAELFRFAKHRVLAQIMHPRLPNEYFRVVQRGLETAIIAGDCIYVPVGDVPTPEFVSEMADYFAPLKGARWSVATGRFGGNLYFSIRSLSARKDAGRLLRKAMGALGVAGGHRRMAGGVLQLEPVPPAKREAAEARVISSLLDSIGANTAVARPLLAVTGQ